MRVFEKLVPRRLRVEGPVHVRLAGSKRTVERILIEAAGSAVVLLDAQTRSPVELRPAKQSLRLTPHQGYTRSFTGRVSVTAKEDHLHIVATLPLEDYIAGVVAAEMPTGPQEAQKAQAIVARTYALQEKNRHVGYDFCDLTHCQAFKGVPDPRFRPRIESTRGRFLQTSTGRPAPVYYSSTCGGHTTSARQVWGDGEDGDIQDGVSDIGPDGRPWCENSPHATWRFGISAVELGSRLRAVLGEQVRIPAGIRTRRATNGWIDQVWIDGAEKPLSGEQFHIQMGRIFGWGKFKSARFNLVEESGRFVFNGEGLGHGVGLCQHGAMAMALAGRDHAAILRHYFPRLVLGDR